MKLHEYLGKPAYVYEGKTKPFPTADYLGIEIELENITLPRLPNRIPEVPAPGGWVYHIDDSLRNNGLEFVFNGPTCGVKIAERLENLISWIKDTKQKPDASNRTSVHIHVDAGDCTPEEMLKWLLIYTVYEPLLFEAYAPERKDSNFCIPISASFDTRRTITILKRGWVPFFKELGRVRGTRRYSAVNLDAVSKFGSLEFRHLGGTYKPKPIIDWANVLLYLKMWAKDEKTSVNEIFHGPSKYYCQQMTSNIFSEEYAEKFLSLEKFTELYLEGVRSAQEIYLDEKIPEIPTILLPRINEVRQQKNAKKIEILKDQISKMKDINPDRDEQEDYPAGDFLPQIPPRAVRRPDRPPPMRRPEAPRVAVPAEANPGWYREQILTDAEETETRMVNLLLPPIAARPETAAEIRQDQDAARARELLNLWRRNRIVP